MDVTDAVDRELPGALQTLGDLVAIQSVSADPARAGQVQRSADTIADLLRDAGCPEVSVISAGGPPSVLARYPAPPGRPTVCLYAHHDVQPEGDPNLWQSPPFVATERDGRLYGRGTSDDKGGFAVHLAALRAFDGKPPVGVTLLIEGEEEIGSPTMAQLLLQHREELAADVFVIADSGNWALGEPAFTTMLRGLTDCTVEVRTLDHAIHSGMFGGVVPDALTTLCRLLATLQDDKGNVAIAGLASGPGPDLDYSEDRVRREAGLLDGVSEIGDGTIVERMWTRPAVSVIALDATPIAQASNTLWPSARAKISLRLAPGDDGKQALGRLTEHLERHAPWGAHVMITPGQTAEPWLGKFEGPYADAAFQAFTQGWGKRPVSIGMGGTIPLMAELTEAYPSATLLLTAVADPDSRPHGANESLDLADFRSSCRAESLMLEAFGRLPAVGG